MIFTLVESIHKQNQCGLMCWSVRGPRY